MEAFKKALVPWAKHLGEGLFKDSFIGRMAEPLIMEVIEANLDHPTFNLVLNAFVKDGEFCIDSLIDRYKEHLGNDGIKFKWEEIHPGLSILGSKTNVITKDDLQKLKDLHYTHRRR